MEALLSFNAIYVVHGSKNDIPIRADKASLINISHWHRWHKDIVEIFLSGLFYLSLKNILINGLKVLKCVRTKQFVKICIVDVTDCYQMDLNERIN